MEIADNILRSLLKNCYFINGTAYAGKSTMVRLLARRHDGIECGENYHDALMDAIDPAFQPNLGYFETMSGWREFLSRTPEEYVGWTPSSGSSKYRAPSWSWSGSSVCLRAAGRSLWIPTCPRSG